MEAGYLHPKSNDDYGELWKSGEGVQVMANADNSAIAAAMAARHGAPQDGAVGLIDRGRPRNPTCFGLVPLACVVNRATFGARPRYLLNSLEMQL